jgi:hypothetical protein
MPESIFHRLEDEWRDGEHHAGDWFHRHARHDGSAVSAGDSISAGETQAPSPPGDIVSLATIAQDIKTAVESAEVNVRTVLDQHMPGLVALAERVENDPLIQAAEAAALPPGAKLIVADFIAKLAGMFPEPSPAPAQDGAVLAAPADVAQVLAADPAALEHEAA